MKKLLYILVSFFWISNVFAQSQTFTTTGTTSWVVPAGVNSITVQAYGAGGGGGNDNKDGGAGGGGSAYISTTINVTAGETLVVFVPTGGAPEVAGGDATVSRGGTVLVRAKGGSAGIDKNPGSGGDRTLNVPASTGASGGIGGEGDKDGGGGGGASGSSSGTGAAGDKDKNGGAGGTGVSGGGSGGDGGAKNSPGANGTAPGGGGGGSGKDNNSAGSGGNGQITFNYVITNLSPTINLTDPATTAVTINQGNSLNLAWNATDPDGTIVNGQWRETTTAGYTTITGAGPFTATTPVYNTLGTFTAQVLVEDNEGGLSVINITVTVSKDTDRDGVPDSLDIDDDNDGILDDNELVPAVLPDFSENTTYNFAQNSTGGPAAHFGFQGTGDQDDPNLFFDGDINSELRLHEFDIIQFEFPRILPAGTNLILQEGAGVEDANAAVYVSAVSMDPNNDANNGTNGGTGWQNTITNGQATLIYSGPSNGNVSFTLPIDAKYIQLVGLGNHGGWAEITFDGVGANLDPEGEDSDGDGIPDREDLDCDNDGIPDNVEAQTTKDYIIPTYVDTDGDGLMDVYDLTPNGSSDGTGSIGLIPVDTDGDTVVDFLDLDSDDDGIFDIDEAGIRTADNDTNDDGVTDNTAGENGLEDANGIETIDDYSDVNGLSVTGSNFLLLDSDGDLLADRSNANLLNNNYDWRQLPDNDKDGIADVNDLDDDNDGILDTDEGNSPGTVIACPSGLSITNVTSEPIIQAGSTNTLYDGVTTATNFYFLDGQIYSSTIEVIFEITLSEAARLTQLTVLTQEDGNNLSFLGSGVRYRVEGLNGTVWEDIPGSEDVSDGIITDYLGNEREDFDLSGNLNAYTKYRIFWITGGQIQWDVWIEEIEFVCAPVNSDADNDGTPDHLDLDSDNDGIPDLVEAGGVDIDGNGIVDVFTDDNSNGWADIYDDDAGLGSPGTPLADINTDGDSYPNRIDIDSDGDGIVDAIEAQATTATLQGTIDSDGDGTLDEFESGFLNATTLIDTDGDGTPDYLDLDSDDDGESDFLEAYDTDGNGVIDGTEIAFPGVAADLDEDGLDDAFDNAGATNNATNDQTATNPFPNTDTAGGEPNWREGIDTDGDGIIDPIDLDDDNDGVLDEVECLNTSTPEIIFDFGTGTSAEELSSIYPNASTSYTFDDLSGSGSNPDYFLLENTYTIINDGYQAWSPTVFTNAFCQTQVRGNTTGNIDDRFYTANGSTTTGTVLEISNIAIEQNVAYEFGYDQIQFIRNTNPVVSSDITIEIIDLSNNNVVFTSTSTTEGSICSWEEISGIFNSGAVTNITIRFIENSGGSGGNDFGIDNIRFTPLFSCIDSDGDGIPNSLDLDSDNDGCPDAIESAVPSVFQSSGTNANDGITDNTDNAVINTVLDPVGTNGFANSLETVVDNGIIANAFTTTNYNTYALDNTKNGCGTPMITQVYWKGTEKIIEVTNNAPDKIVVPNAANVNFFDGGTTTSRTATAVNTTEITAGTSILFASGALTAQVKSGVAPITNAGITGFDNTNDIITISRSGKETSTLAYESRIDVISGLTNNTAFVRIDETLVPNTTFTAAEWVAFVDDDIPIFGDPAATGTQRHPNDPLLSEITSGVNTEANALLGLHNFGITTRTGNAWNNGYPDRSRFVVIDEDYNHTTANLNARKLTVNAAQKLGVTDNLLVVTNDVVLNGDIRLINTSGATGNSEAQFIQTHSSASLVTATGKLLVDQNSTVPSLYRYNYMSSPVKETAGSSTYSIANVFKDGTNPTSFGGIVNTNIAKDITFVGGNNYNGNTTDPITLADYWMYTYETENATPADWEQVRSTGNINNMDGFIFKGPGRAQNYTFLGVPKDGTLTTTINGFDSYLVGNPYPSALSVVEFIQDNLSATTGVLYFWEHVGEESTAEAISGHLYSGYKGGYATRTILTGVDAKAAGGGPSNVLLESSLSTNAITGTIETILDGQIPAEVVLLDSATDNIEFREMSRSVDTLIVRYSSTEAKTLEFLQASRGSLKSYELPSTGGQLKNDTIPICLISGKTLTLKSLDTKEINIDYIRLYDNDGDVDCAPSTNVTEFTFTEPKEYIPIGQGFFVSGDTDGGTITFNNSQREYVTEGAKSVFFKTSNRKESSTGIPIIKIGMNHASGTSTSLLHRQLAISFDNAQSFNYEKGYDAEMFDIGTTDFYWKFPNDEDKYVIAGVQAISNDLEVPLELVMGYSGEISITLDEVKNINQDIYITDKVDGISYKITNTKATLSLGQGVYNNRFVLAFKQTNTLATDDDLGNAFSNIYVDNKNSFINITKRGEIDIENVELFDLLGKQISSWKIKEQKESYQLKINRKLPTGVYIVKLNSNRGESNKKVIIE